MALPTPMAYFANQPHNSLLLVLDLASKSSQHSALGANTKRSEQTHDLQLIFMGLPWRPSG